MNGITVIKGLIQRFKKMIKKQKDITVLSESSLKKDWLKPEEDKAWKNL